MHSLERVTYTVVTNTFNISVANSNKGWFLSHVSCPSHGTCSPFVILTQEPNPKEASSLRIEGSVEVNPMRNCCSLQPLSLHSQRIGRSWPEVSTQPQRGTGGLAFHVLGMKEEVGVSSANECLSVFHSTKITRESHVSSGTADPLVSLVFQWWCLQSDNILPLFAFTLWYDASPRSWYTLEKLKPNIFEKFFWTEAIYENYAGLVYISWRSLGIKVIENIYRSVVEEASAHIPACEKCTQAWVPTCTKKSDGIPTLILLGTEGCDLTDYVTQRRQLLACLFQKDSLSQA